MDDLTKFVEKLKNAFHDRLVSVILYGSAAPGGAEDGFSDLNVLCVLKQVTPRELEDGEPVMHWWRNLNHPAPVVLSETEVAQSADSFPIEFYDMKLRRRVLFGVDVIEHLDVDRRNYRTQVEHELRSKLLRLRRHAGHVISDGSALLTLCLNSSSTFSVLGRHALILGGIDAPQDRRLVVSKLGELLHADMSAFARMLEIRQNAGVAVTDNPQTLFAAYLECIRRIVEYVDGLG